ncbi:MAG: YigZ family protein [Maritimibacter sp.]|jgi:putative IMPACT (imprinted ancient) family translation regulator
MQVFENIFSDRGSKYAVTGAKVASRDDIRAVLKELTRKKKFAKATHNSWAAILPDGPTKGDDGEAGAGAVILQKLQGAGLDGHVVIVSRWFGGTKLGGDRFRRVADAVDYYLENAKL